MEVGRSKKYAFRMSEGRREEGRGKRDVFGVIWKCDDM